MPTIRGGKPRPNSSTRIPAHLAVIKWPNSCTRMQMPKTGMAANKYQLFIIYLYLTIYRTQFACCSARPGAGLKNRLDIGSRDRFMALQHGFYQFRDAGVANLARQEQRDSLLVGPDQHAGIGAAAMGCLQREAEAGETRHIQALKIQLAHLRPAQFAQQASTGSIQPLWIAQRVQNGQVYGGQASLHLDGAINELDHRVNDALRVNDNFDTFVGHIKKPVRLKHLQALIH